MNAQFDLLIARTALQNIYARNVRRSGQRGCFHKRLVRELRRINNQILNLGRAS